MNTPVLLIAWRRPCHLIKVIDAVRKVEPKNVFVAVDGPRIGDNYSEERQLIIKTKEVIEREIDWDCKLMLNYQEKNLGCRLGVSSAISWFFSNVDEGIILEDDCVPSLDFFKFSVEMLNKYRDNYQIMHITGNNFNRGHNFNRDSYYFSDYNHAWGWATWKRAWEHYHYSLEYWLEIKNKRFLEKYLKSRIQLKFWTKYYEEIFVTKELDTWDYVWRLNIWFNNGLTISPNVNLVANIGFDDLATHTQNGLPTPIEVLNFPLKHPQKIVRNRQTDLWTFQKQIAERYVIKHSLRFRIIRRVKKYLKLK